MPNGGSDCCGTCCFDQRAGEAANQPITDPVPLPGYCEIRGLDIVDPFWTYCANHPHHNPRRIRIPVGPVFTCDSYPYTRRVLFDGPDTEAVRAGLLDLLERINPTPDDEYPSQTQFDEQIIDQLMAFRERRAINGLRRVVRFDPTVSGEHGCSRAVTVGHAIEALAALAGDEALDDLGRCVRCGRAEVTQPYDPQADPLAAVRYHAVRGLAFCRSEAARELLREALTDPHPEVTAFAREVLSRLPTSPG
jgi:hypothetical protein